MFGDGLRDLNQTAHHHRKWQPSSFIVPVRCRVDRNCDAVAAVGGGTWQPLHAVVFFFLFLADQSRTLLGVDEAIVLTRNLVFVCGFPRVKKAHLIALRRLRAAVVLCVCGCVCVWEDRDSVFVGFLCDHSQPKPLTRHTTFHRKK